MRNQPSLDNFRMDVKVTAKICGTMEVTGLSFVPQTHPIFIAL